MNLPKMIIAASLGLFLTVGGTSLALAQSNDKELNRLAIQMWLQQKAQQGIYFPDPHTAGQALQYEQRFGSLPYQYGPVYSPYHWSPYGWYR